MKNVLEIHLKKLFDIQIGFTKERKTKTFILPQLGKKMKWQQGKLPTIDLAIIDRGEFLPDYSLSQEFWFVVGGKFEVETQKRLP